MNKDHPIKSWMEDIRIDHESVVPKYRQLAEAILTGIASGKLKPGAVLPSLHELCIVLEVSRNTVEKAYNTLKRSGLVGAYQGKAYYVNGENIVTKDEGEAFIS